MDTFMLVLGILFAFMIAMYFLANHITDASHDMDMRSSKIEQQMIEQRLAPVGQDAIAGQTPPPSQQQAAATAKPAKSEPKSGKEIWEGTCSACHGTGAAGAPKIGDKKAWAPRIAKGLKTLEQHALHGFQSNGLVMPAKGGNPGLSDAEVIKAMKYMVDQSK
jgi:cytochrome c5